MAKGKKSEGIRSELMRFILAIDDDLESSLPSYHHNLPQHMKEDQECISAQ